MPVAFALRLEGTGQGAYYAPLLPLYTFIGAILKAALAYRFGLHRQSWRKVSVRDLFVLSKAVGASVVILIGIVFVAPAPLSAPRSVPIIDGLLAFLALGGVRLSNRLWHERQRRQAVASTARRVLVVGAGEAGTMLVREMLRHPESGIAPVGFLDDEKIKQRQRFMDLPVFGGVDDLPRVVRQANIDEVLVSMPSAPGSVVRHVVEMARQARVSCRTVPGLYEIASGQVTISQLREVALEDLLRREPVQLDLEKITGYLKDRVVLVTGAGGSIGSEIVRQVTRFRPRSIILLGRGENSLYELERELARSRPGLVYHLVVADIRDRAKLAYVFEKYRPQVVFHAAAHKHVPMMEMNPDEAVFNNVGGTRNLVELVLEYDVARFVNISTDKAVNPTSVMGASKRIAEYIVDLGMQRAKPGQVLIVVRFGNVLGSRGSVVPLFKEQIRVGGPITVTHPEITRYFMTIPEAAQLVIEAGGIGENGMVYVLDMGEPVKIVNLAEDLIRLSGLEPGEDIEVVFTGMRPGEKLYEEVMTEEEETLPSHHEKIFVARRNTPPEGELNTLLSALFDAAAARDGQRIRQVMRQLVPGYHQPDVTTENGR
ncbi:MAG: polysaccharide biosynthesis protein [Anaerolineae bacterium]|nr:polysaccharide biosynthesis protein [Anaerolineae bacterium]